MGMDHLDDGEHKILFAKRPGWNHDGQKPLLLRGNGCPQPMERILGGNQPAHQREPWECTHNHGGTHGQFGYYQKPQYSICSPVCANQSHSGTIKRISRYAGLERMG